MTWVVERFDNAVVVSLPICVAVRPASWVEVKACTSVEVSAPKAVAESDPI